MNTCVVGLNHGDEGKGKIVDLIAEDYDAIVRYNGGANAGHTVKVDDKTFKFHHVPSGCIANPDAKIVLAGGMVINPLTLWEELQPLIKEGNISSSNILISAKTHCVMPWHLAADIRKGGKIGTTKRGIGPCYADKAHRWNAIRLGDLLPKMKTEKMRDFFAVDQAFHGEGLWEKYYNAARRITELLADTESFLRDAVRNRTNVLFESANGFHLDIDHGTFPYVTSSAVGPAGIPQSCGLPNLHLDRIIGVIKCYATRVGEGPFPSEIISQADEREMSSPSAPTSREWYKYTNKPYPKKECEIAHLIRDKGKEYGTTTGRPRRIGWLDLMMTKEAVAGTGATEIALMHNDTMANMGAFKYIDQHGERKEHEGWDDISSTSHKSYIRIIEDALEIPVKTISYGAKRSQTSMFPKWHFES